MNLAPFKCAVCGDLSPIQLGLPGTPTVCMDCGADMLDDPTDPDFFGFYARIAAVGAKRLLRSGVITPYEQPEQRPDLHVVDGGLSNPDEQRGDNGDG